MVRNVTVLASARLIVNPGCSLADASSESPASSEGVSGVQPPRQISRKVDAFIGIAEPVPHRFMAQIKQRTNDQRKGRQAGRRRDLADHDIIDGEIQRRDDDPIGDGFGNRLLDRELDGKRRLDDRQVLRGSVWQGSFRRDRRAEIEQRLQAPAQAAQGQGFGHGFGQEARFRKKIWCQNRGAANHHAGNQCDFEQGDACGDYADGRPCGHDILRQARHCRVLSPDPPVAHCYRSTRHASISWLRRLNQASHAAV